jgi:hypothetical protein
MIGASEIGVRVGGSLDGVGSTRAIVESRASPIGRTGPNGLVPVRSTPTVVNKVSFLWRQPVVPGRAKVL